MGNYDIAYARELREKYYSWREELDFFLMEAKLALALKLLRGELTAVARYCDDPDKRDSLLESGDCEIIKHTNAPKHIFQFTKIDWQGANINHKGSEYFDICVDTLAVIREFPIGDAEAVHAHAVADALIVEPQTPSVLPPKRRGRPSLPWPEMYVELGRRAERGELPAKQEALIAEMMDWCHRKWGRRPSRSAIQSHLPPDIAKK